MSQNLLFPHVIVVPSKSALVSLGSSTAAFFQACSSRLYVCRAKVVITASGGARGSKVVLLKQITDKAVQLAAKEGFKASIDKCLSNVD